MIFNFKSWKGSSANSKMKKYFYRYFHEKWQNLLPIVCLFTVYPLFILSWWIVYCFTEFVRFFCHNNCGVCDSMVGLVWPPLFSISLSLSLSPSLPLSLSCFFNASDLPAQLLNYSPPVPFLNLISFCSSFQNALNGFLFKKAIPVYQSLRSVCSPIFHAINVYFKGNV